MRRLLLLPALALAVLWFLPASGGANTPDEGPLAEAMEEMDAHMRTLRKTLKDPARGADSLAAIVGLQGAVNAAKVEVPPMARGLEGEAREAFVRDYRKAMIDLGEDLLALERHVVDGDLEKAMEAYKAVRKHEDPGHERFTEEE
jgi:soluble cytochrome b562